MKIKSFSPCADWYFVFKDPMGKTINYQLAGYAVVEGANGEADSVVGLVPVDGGGQDKTMPGTCRLVTVPPVHGTYTHESRINREG